MASRTVEVDVRVAPLPAVMAILNASKELAHAVDQFVNRPVRPGSRAAEEPMVKALADLRAAVADG